MSNNQNIFQDTFPKITIYQLVFFLIWPFGILLHSIKNIRTPSSKTIFWIYCIYFGFVYIYDDPFASGGADSARYAAKFIELYNNPISFQTLISMFYVTKIGYTDIYQPLLSWFLSFFCGDPRLLFTMFALIFGYFYTQNLWIIFNKINKNYNLFLILLMLSFALVIPIWQITGARMWTAAQIFVYGSFRYFLFHEKKGLAWSASAILVHFSYLVPVSILMMWLIIPKKSTSILFGFYMITVFMSITDINLIRTLIPYLPEVFQYKATGYTSDAALERLSQGALVWNWHVILARYSIGYMIDIWVIAIFLMRKKWSSIEPNLYQLFSFALLIGSFANLLAPILSGGRFAAIASYLFFAIFVVLFGQRKIYFNLKILENFTLPVLAYNVIFKIRMGFDFIGVLAIFGNPLVAPLMKDQTPFIDFVKHFFS